MREKYVVKRQRKAVRIIKQNYGTVMLYQARDWPDLDAAEADARRECARMNAGEPSTHTGNA